MGYYIRVLGTKDPDIPVSTLRESLKTLDVDLDVEDGVDDRFSELLLRHKDGIEIAAIERNPVADGKLGKDEMQEFADDVAAYKPQTAARWLRDYFKRVKVIYAFQLLGGTDHKRGWQAVGELK